mmetsp:Transcript_1836/g.8207  ORF Transcript_1836/g.8207 Transcript_1836/m.8207 type:complete len:206 (+) Transcript_1836:601-1218(+)
MSTRVSSPFGGNRSTHTHSPLTSSTYAAAKEKPKRSISVSSSHLNRHRMALWCHGATSSRSSNPIGSSMSFLYATFGSLRSNAWPLYTASPTMTPASSYSAQGCLPFANQTECVSSSHSKPTRLLKTCGAMSWKNSFCTPPSSTPSSPTNRTRSGLRTSPQRTWYVSCRIVSARRQSRRTSSFRYGQLPRSVDTACGSGNGDPRA